MDSSNLFADKPNMANAGKTGVNVMPIISFGKLDKGTALEKKKTWTIAETRENLSTGEAIFRGVMIVLGLPVLMIIDWSFHTDTLVYSIPVFFYLEITAFIMYCPIKALLTEQGPLK